MEFLPVSNYSVLKAKAVDSRFGLGHNPHYCIKAIGKNKYNIYNVDIDCF